MPPDFEIRGADEFLRLSKALKEAGRTDMRKGLHKGLKDATKPLTRKTQQRLAEGLPLRLKAQGARTKQVVQVRTGRDPGVRIVVQYGKRGAGLGAANARLANRGLIRHPVFARQSETRKQWTWVTTRAPRARGWFDDTLRRETPVVRTHLEQVINGVLDDIVRSVERG